MPTVDCNSYNAKPVAQTLFLGASVSSFSANMGWGGQPSSLSITLVEDLECCPGSLLGGATSPVFPGRIGGRDNHYYTCSGDECYMDQYGGAWQSNRLPPPPEQFPRELTKMLPGKLFYTFNSQGQFVSRYWRNGDPGFFATGTTIPNSDAGAPNLQGKKNCNGTSNANNFYDIIGTPVYFKMGQFAFCGLVQSWEQDVGSGGNTYRVTIEGPDNILNNSWVIIGDYSGSVFNLPNGGQAYGGPLSGSTNSMSGKGTLSQGAIHNIFNVYGFLESMGADYFGAARINDNGLRANDIVQALKVLTSSVNNRGQHQLQTLNKDRFSPFGRILVKGLADANTLQRYSIKSHGIVPAFNDVNNQLRCQCVLDLNELPGVPEDFRISGSVISIMDLIRQITDEAGFDFYWEMIPAPVAWGLSDIVLVMKLHTVDRRFQPSTSIISNTINQYYQAGFPINTATVGKEASESNVRSLLFGAPLQRLFQAKSYRLGYRQSNYIYEPTTLTFIDYAPMGSSKLGKMRFPDGYSQRNPAISAWINGAANTTLLNMSEDFRTNATFSSIDPATRDPWGGVGSAYGNYAPTFSLTSFTMPETRRFIPLYEDVICPFFGYQNEDNIQLATGDDANVFRRVRPVWLDTWTGQINVVMHTSELPLTSIPLASVYGSAMFSITESELRCAMIGSEEYLIYCLEKIFKPDLFLMLINAYRAAGQPISTNFESWEPKANAAGPTGNPAAPTPDQGDIMGANFDIFLMPNFLRDFNILQQFVANIANKYYGKKYMVRMPTIRAYQDKRRFSINGSTGGFSVYQGSGKIYYNYEPCEEAWEEEGNVIDNDIVVGSVNHFALANDNGCIPPIIGYNASNDYDRISAYLSTLRPQQFLFLLGNDRYASQNPSVSTTTELVAQFQASQSSAGHMKPSLDVGGLSSTSYIVTDTTAHPDAFDRRIPDGMAKKLFAKTTVEKDLAFLNPTNLTEPRAIIDAPGLTLSSSSIMYETDPNRTVIANVSIEDLGIYIKSLGPGGALDIDFVKYMLSYCSPIYSTSFLKGNPFNASSKFPSMAAKAAHPIFAGIPIKSKVFTYGPWTNYPHLIRNEIFPGNSTAANNGVENLVGGVKAEYDPDLAPWNYGGMSLLDRVAFKKIQNNANYQQVCETGQIQTVGLPIFGIGTSFLFRPVPQYAAQNVIHGNIVYSLSSTQLTYTDYKEQPTLQNLPAPVVEAMFSGSIINPPPAVSPIRNILNYNVYSLAGTNEVFAPIITSIGISVGREVTSTYSFRTHTRKLSLFNKTEVDRIKQASLENTRRNKLIGSVYSNLTSSINQQKQSILKSLESGQGFGSGKSLSQRNKFYDWSPALVMIGGSYPFIPNQFIKEMSKNSKDKARTARTTPENKPESPTTVEGITLWHGRDPGDDSVNSSSFTAKPYETLYKMYKRRTYAGSFQPSEAKTELARDYHMKSCMSMDGLFSPVSFYPTWASSTYSMLLYEKDKCPFCNGTQVINQEVYNYATKAKESVDYTCPYCGVPDVPRGTSKTQLKKSAESLPPYVIASGTDISTLLSMESAGGSSSNSSDNSENSSTSEEGLEIPINMFSLQPIVVPYGYFRNPNAETDSRCRHSIQVVARGKAPPKNETAFSIYSNYGAYFKPDGTQQKPDENGTGYNIDFYEYDLADGGTKLMNHRFFGLRGPLTLHSWGYDTEGYPVPNAADEPLIYDGKGRPKRFVLRINRTNQTYSSLENGDLFEFPIGEIARRYVKRSKPIVVQDSTGAVRLIGENEQVTLVEIENDPTHPGSFESVPGRILGAPIGKGWSLENNKWVKKKDTKFYKDWGERPDLWPVGPIDMRWDENRKVWATASDSATIYKFVYVTLEEDLIKESYTDETYPARGFLDDTEYSTEPLRQNYRRLVLVKDRAGYTAPRGAKLLCRYDQDTGFYEPISKPAYIVKGIINSGTQATLEMSYVQGKRRGETNPTMLVNFENSFAFNIISGNRGMFSFNAGRWTLIAAKET